MVVRKRAAAFSLASALAIAGLLLAYVTIRPFGGVYLYFPLTAVVTASLVGGLWPGLFTLGLSLVGFDHVFIAHAGELWRAGPRDIHRLLEFALAGSTGAWLCDRYRQTRIAAEEAAAEATRVGRLQEQLVSVVSHDLNNPLAALRTGLDLLERLGPLEARQKAALERMRSSAKRMERLVFDLLGLARGRSDRGFPVRRVRAALGAVCETVVAEYRQTFPARALLLSVKGDDRGDLDPARLEQVASNLISNAIRHGDAAAPIGVFVMGLPEELALLVENRGPPIPPDLLPRIFEPFRSGAEERGGLGLGLFVVREIVRAHGGSVSIRSDSRATTFEVRLPRFAGDRRAKDAPHLEGAVAARPRPSSPPPRS